MVDLRLAYQSFNFGPGRRQLKSPQTASEGAEVARQANLKSWWVDIYAGWMNNGFSKASFLKSIVAVLQQHVG